MDDLEEVKLGAPAWMATFADLMSLLMCFFVMLLSFAEMDALKFKQVAENLERAFGVQREVRVIEVPMGTSPDLTHFSPGKPEPTSQDTVKQHTTDDLSNLETFTGDTTIPHTIQETVDRQVEQTQKHLEEELSEELMSGQLQIERVDNRIIVRIEEKGSFPAGSADFAPAFAKSLERIANAVARIPGDLSVEGHSDDIPMKGARFRSNWELSSSRAAVVASALLQVADIPPTRLRVQGFAETRPRVPNDSTPNRALNRRVEVVIDLAQSVAILKQQVIELIDGGRPDLADDLEPVVVASVVVPADVGSETLDDGHEAPEGRSEGPAAARTERFEDHHADADGEVDASAKTTGDEDSEPAVAQVEVEVARPATSPPSGPTPVPEYAEAVVREASLVEVPQRERFVFSPPVASARRAPPLRAETDDDFEREYEALKRQRTRRFNTLLIMGCAVLIVGGYMVGRSPSTSPSVDDSTGTERITRNGRTNRPLRTIWPWRRRVRRRIRRRSRDRRCRGHPTG